MVTLRPYQTEAISAVNASEGRGIKRPLITLPTRTGKTVVFASLLLQRPGRSLILVHRDELIHQAYARLKELDPGRPIGIVKADLDEHEADTVIASVQTLSKPARLTRLAPVFQTIIVDEAHHAVAESYRRVLAHFRSFSEDGPLTLGVTATPKRGDEVGLDAVFQEIVYQKNIREMILAGYLADLRALRIRVDADFGSLHTKMGDYQDGELEALLLECNAPEQIVQAYQEYASGRKALVFAPTVNVARILAATFQHAEIDAESLDGKTKIEERRAILKRFKSGETRVLANCGVLTEGFDEPSVDCVIVARPTKSATLYAQMIGRGTRVYPGKQDCLVLDLVGVTGRHDLQTVAELVGLPLDALKNGTSVSEAVAEQAERQQLAAHRRKLQAHAVNLFHRHALHWLSASGSFVLPVGKGWVVLSPETTEDDEERWAVTTVSTTGSKNVMAAGLSLAYAQGTAEDYARGMGAAGLVNPSAKWRKKALSDYPRMVAALERMRIPHHANITAGEASDLISTALLARVYKVDDVSSVSEA